MCVPHIYNIKDIAKDLNSKFDVMPAPEGVIGVQQSLQSHLLVKLKSLPYPNETVQIKLSGDGTGIATHINVINFTFTLLNEKY